MARTPVYETVQFVDEDCRLYRDLVREALDKAAVGVWPIAFLNRLTSREQAGTQAETCGARGNRQLKQGPP